jgi:hypothetical protein
MPVTKLGFMSGGLVTTRDPKRQTTTARYHLQGVMTRACYSLLSLIKLRPSFRLLGEQSFWWNPGLLFVV